MSDFQIKRATRQGVRPLIGFYSESGCGKTYSALLLARGLAGASGKIVMVDSESGRGSLYADVIPGGYETMEIAEPFSPARYIQAVQSVEKSGAAIGILDSGSHEWEGLGGVLDMAGEIEQKSGRTGLHCWRNPKMEHAKFMLKLLQSPIPWIVCLRAKHKSRQTKDANGKTVIIKDEFTTPIQADDFIFEMTCHAEILQDHSAKLTKCSHPDLVKCFPDRGPIKIEHGERLAQWCNTASGGPKAQPSATTGISNPAEAITSLKRILWDLLKPVRGTEKNWKLANQWCIDEALMDPTETISEMNQDQLRALIEKARAKLEGAP